ncbi:MAG: hypothetical protein ACFE95_02610 [Candidatus Hodarchaeota archaeon]
MSYFKLGVFAPIANFRFRHPYRWYSTLSSAAAVGATSLSVNNHTPTDGGGVAADKFLQKGDKLTVGVSTASGSVGKTENVIIRTVSSNAITLESGLTYGYSNTDPVSGTGSKCPDKFYPWGGLATPQGFEQPDEGYSDRWGLKFHSNYPGNAFIRQRLESNIFENSLYYKYGFWYKNDYISGSGSPSMYFFADIKDGVSQFQNTVIRSSSQSTWTETSKIFASSPMCEEQGSATLRQINFGAVVDSGNPEMTVWVDDIYLEHSDPTDVKTETMDDIITGGGLTNIRVVDISDFAVGNTVLLSGIASDVSSLALDFSTTAGDRAQSEGTISAITSSSNELIVNLNSAIAIDKHGIIRKKGDCYYQFPDNPEYGSVQLKRVSSFRFDNIAGKLRGFSNYGDASKEEVFEVSMTFPIVATTFYQNVLKYIRRQEAGELLILHTEDLIPELPLPFLVGFAQVDQDTKNFWDADYCTFSFKFTGF